MKPLSEIYLDYQSPEGHGDKGTAHSYIDEYQRLLTPYRDNSTVLEIGLCMGESLLMWEEFFTNSKVFGVDITPHLLLELIEDNTHNIIIADATKETILEHFSNETFDVIIDDGSHRLDDQVDTFKLFKDKMNSGGIFIIEDVSNIDDTKEMFSSLHDNIEIIDNRHIKRRYDDVLIVYKF
jgi:23S rRNA U2552 (ribose-2'-O)-methylase RlmE/FtsJ